MHSIKYKLAAHIVLSCLAFPPLIAYAQEPYSAATLYSSGVNAYFRGCSAEAESSFSSLMGVDPDDPRAFYFRALTLMTQGRVDEARTDMEVGAEIEARVPNRFDIGKTLERVQGPTRLMLERYRNKARQAAATIQPRRAVRAPDNGVLRDHRVVPLDELSRPGQPQSFAAPPLVEEPVRPLTPPPAKPTQSPSAAPAGPPDPFNDDAAAPEAAPKAEPKTSPAKAAPPKQAPLPPAPKVAAPEPKPTIEVEKNDDPF